MSLLRRSHSPNTPQLPHIQFGCLSVPWQAVVCSYTSACDVLGSLDGYAGDMVRDILAFIPGRSSSTFHQKLHSGGFPWFTLVPVSDPLLQNIELLLPVLRQDRSRTYPTRSITNSTMSILSSYAGPVYYVSGIRSHRRFELRCLSLLDFASCPS
jgi:hypothetical protein